MDLELEKVVEFFLFRLGRGLEFVEVKSRVVDGEVLVGGEWVFRRSIRKCINLFWEDSILVLVVGFEFCLGIFMFLLVVLELEKGVVSV